MTSPARFGAGGAPAIEEQYDGTVAVFASGSLSHHFADNGRAPEFMHKVYDPFLEQVDHRVVELWKAGRLEDLHRHAADVRDKCWGEGDMHDTAMLLGLLGWDAVRRAGGDRHALLRQFGHRADQRDLPGHAAEALIELIGIMTPIRVLCRTSSFNTPPTSKPRSTCPGPCAATCRPALIAPATKRAGRCFPIGGTRVLAYPPRIYAVADGKGDYGFCYINMRIGAGRSEAVKKSAGDAVLAMVQAHFALAARAAATSA